MRRDEQGFTLPELLATILIMSILFAIATASWQSVIRGRSADAASNQLVADLRLANSRATNQLADWRIAYNSNGSKVGCKTSAVGATATQASYCMNQYDSSGKVVQSLPRPLPDGTQIISSNVGAASSATDAITTALFGSVSYVKFSADGSAAYSGSTLTSDPSITVGVSGGPTHVVTVTLATSKVKSV